jgi:mRNA interferase MazF
VVTPAAGTVVLVPFPFSDLSQAKLRPAVVLADVGRGDWILCQITSNPYGDARTILLTDASFAVGALRVTSYARPGKLFTAHHTLMVSQVGTTESRAVAADHRGGCGYSAYQPETLVGSAPLVG